MARPKTSKWKTVLIYTILDDDNNFVPNDKLNGEPKYEQLRVKGKDGKLIKHFPGKDEAIEALESLQLDKPISYFLYVKLYNADYLLKPMPARIQYEHEEMNPSDTKEKIDNLDGLTKKKPSNSSDKSEDDSIENLPPIGEDEDD